MSDPLIRHQIIPAAPVERSLRWGPIHILFSGDSPEWLGRRLLVFGRQVAFFIRTDKAMGREARLLVGGRRGRWVLRVGTRPTFAWEIRNCSGGYDCEHHRWHVDLEWGRFEWM